MTAARQHIARQGSAPSSQTKPRRRGLSDRAIINLFIWPTLILLIAWNVFPLFYSLYLSFTNYSAIVPTSRRSGWALRTTRTSSTDPQIWKYFATTGRYALVSVGTADPAGFRAGDAGAGEVQGQRPGHHADPDPDDAVAGGGRPVLEADVQPHRLASSTTCWASDDPGQAPDMLAGRFANAAGAQPGACGPWSLWTSGCGRRS